MGRKPNEAGKPLHVVAEHVPAPDAEERLRRAYSLVLSRAAAESEAPEHMGPEQAEQEATPREGPDAEKHSE